MRIKNNKVDNIYVHLSVKSRLNLYIDTEIVARAKLKAEKLGISLSGEVESYLKDFVGEKEIEISEFVKGIGIQNVTYNENYKSDLPDILSEKYLKDE